MIEKMQKVFLCSLATTCQSLISDLMACGCVELVVPEELPEGLERRVSDTYDSERLLGRLGGAIRILGSYSPKKRLLDRRPVVSFRQLGISSNIEKAMEICEQVEAIQKQMTKCRADIGKEEFLVASLEPWQTLDVPLDAEGTRDTETLLMILPVTASLESLWEELHEEDIAWVYQEVSKDAQQLYAVAVCHRSQSDYFWERIRQIGAVKADLSGLEGLAVDNISSAKGRIKALEEKYAYTEEQLRILAENISILQLAYDGIQVKIEHYRAEENLFHTQETVMLSGWVPVRQKTRIEKILNKYQCYYNFQEPAKGEEPPVLLRNNKLVEPFESVTEMYSMPAANSLDPDPVMAPFFFLFFGMMLSDAGYGLILTIAGLLGARVLDVGSGMKKLLKLLGYCGISTVFWGALYGSWFGDAIPKVTEVFFGNRIQVPMLIDPLTDPMTVLILSFVFGYVHILTGLVLKAYLMVRRGHPLAAFFDVGLWGFVLIGLPMLLVGGLVAKAGQLLAIIGAIGLVLTQGRDKKNPLLKAASGVLSLYDITGYFSDILSYSRIMALGLATGVIGQVVNTMGTLPGKNLFGAILFVVVFLLGHTLNLGINALGSYVHTSRLQYVEFFGKFFEGGGQPFRPLRAVTKYVNINNQEE